MIKRQIPLKIQLLIVQLLLCKLLCLEYCVLLLFLHLKSILELGKVHYRVTKIFMGLECLPSEVPQTAQAFKIRGESDQG